MRGEEALSEWGWQNIYDGRVEVCETVRANGLSRDVGRREKRMG